MPHGIRIESKKNTKITSAPDLHSNIFDGLVTSTHRKRIFSAAIMFGIRRMLGMRQITACPENLAFMVLAGVKDVVLLTLALRWTSGAGGTIVTCLSLTKQAGISCLHPRPVLVTDPAECARTRIGYAHSRMAYASPNAPCGFCASWFDAYFWDH